MSRVSFKKKKKSDEDFRTARIDGRTENTVSLGLIKNWGGGTIPQDVNDLVVYVITLFAQT